ncbi:hypothetical protein ASPVEDRAFT_549133 [Aspergillus versicolor CBS 583.65]|uniref:Uncharacterized protein n=1 Tax=Aspergillus versicolor CBS 583.65 TaxID=1036611 RepID=A0A1L9PF35_ASPVE|nr:uncharacterized protein ASPVEDRAFT_549133 [Aspergillus versicolor CBS 583.65]OJJ00138.1 hypothetical protein ASPVEDRAFT_549133 [Aspergillus versicolor CBS 583.65]
MGETLEGSTCDCSLDISRGALERIWLHSQPVPRLFNHKPIYIRKGPKGLSSATGTQPKQPETLGHRYFDIQSHPVDHVSYCSVREAAQRPREQRNNDSLPKITNPSLEWGTTRGGATLQHRRIKKQATATPFAFFAFAQCGTVIWTKRTS